MVSAPPTPFTSPTWCVAPERLCFMLARMDAIRARALLARAPGLSAEHLRALMLAAGGEPARAAQPHAAREVQLPPAARGFLSSPDEAAIEADLAWLAQSGAPIILFTDPDYPPQIGRASCRERV